MLQMAFGGNPLVLQLLENTENDIDRLLDIDSFPAQFRNNNPKLQKYMSTSKYQRLIEYITVLGQQPLKGMRSSGGGASEEPQSTKNRNYKYPLVSAQILSTDNPNTLKMLLNDQPLTIQYTETEVRWVQKQVDECDSEYCSSNGSNRNLDFDDVLEDRAKQTNNSQQENIPPQKERPSIQSQSKLSPEREKSDSGEGSKKSITSDDFPFADVDNKKVVKVRQTISRRIKREVKPFLGQLFQYFNGEVNHTLAGYICKVLEFLLKKSPERLINYIFKNKLYGNMLKHCQSHSVCQFFTNLLMNPQKQAQLARLQLYITVLKRINAGASSEPSVSYLDSKSYLHIANDVLSRLDPFSTSGPSGWHRKFIQCIFKEETLEVIGQTCFKPGYNYSAKELGFQTVSCLLKKMKNHSPNQKTQVQEEDFPELKKKLYLHAQVLFKDFISKTWDSFSNINSQAQQAKQTSPQLMKAFKVPSQMIIRSLQICSLLLKQNLYWSRMQLSNEHAAYRELVQLCKLVPSNNLLHNNVFDVLKFVVNNAQEEPALAIKMFEEKTLLSFLLEAIHYGSKKDSTRQQLLYRGQCIILSHMIRNSHSEVIKELRTKSAKWKKIQQILSQDIDKNNRALGGFTIKRMMKPHIMFEKEAILSHYKHFLKGQIPQKKAESSDQEGQVEDLTSSRGSTEWTDWNDFTNYEEGNIDD